jgi:hypothetical protein
MRILVARLASLLFHDEAQHGGQNQQVRAAPALHDIERLSGIESW